MTEIRREARAGDSRASGIPPGVVERRAAPRRLEDRLARMRDESSLAVHELRAPLTVARGYSSLLLDGSLGPGPDSWSKAIGLIAGKLAEANALVDSLLLVARLDDTNTKALKEDLDLVALARSAGARAISRADQLGGVITYVNEAAEVHARGDSKMAAIVIDNLLNNALLYGGPAPAVEIRVANAPVPSVSVTDRGRGIGSADQVRIFERFFRISDRSEKPGSGLGLYLCVGLAERQGGTVSLDWSELGEGSTFSLRLPAA